LNQELALLIGKRFIQRRDIKAVQIALRDRVIYMPDREMKHLGQDAPLGFLVPHLHRHLEGLSTYGHYLLDHEDNCRVFTFDIDLKSNDDNFTGYYIPTPTTGAVLTEEEWEQHSAPVAFDPRSSWADRAHPSRNWLKLQMGMLARKLVSGIQENLGIKCAAAYSGNKGIHVYGFFETPVQAAVARRAANLVLNASQEWELARGQQEWKYSLDDPFLGYPNFSLEVYPKQDSLDGKDLGNLVRLPLGRNLKSPDPTFFLDLTTPPGVMQPHPDPVRLLTEGDPYQ